MQAGLSSRLTRRFVFKQWLGNLLLMLAAGGWLQIPDSHSWQFVLSILVAVAWVVAFLLLYTRTFRGLRVCGTRTPLWLSCLILAGFVVLWWLGLKPIAFGRAHEALVAGYLNSQSTPWVRHHFGYSSMVAWQERIYDGLQCLWAGLLLPVTLEMCACGLNPGWLLRAVRVYRKWLYWVCIFVFGLGASAATWALVDWAPSGGLAGQTISVVGRLGVAYTVDIVLWCMLLAIVAHCLSARSPSAPK